MFFNKSNDGDDKKGRTANLPLLPLRDIIVFPHMVVPLFVGREKSIRALEEAMAGDKEILLAAQKKAKTNEPAAEDIYGVGTIGTIIQLLRLPDGTVKVLVEGKRRGRIKRFVPHETCFLCEVESMEELASPSVELEALVRQVQSTFEAYIKLNKRIAPETLMHQCRAAPGRSCVHRFPLLRLVRRDCHAIRRTPRASPARRGLWPKPF